MINGDKCITKEIAWQDIARNLATDGELANCLPIGTNQSKKYLEKKNYKIIIHHLQLIRVKSDGNIYENDMCSRKKSAIHPATSIYHGHI